MIAKPNISKSTLQLFYGIVLSAFVIVQSVHVTPANEVEVDQTEKNDTSESGETTVSQSQAISHSASQINLGFDSYLMDVVTFKEINNDNKAANELLVSRLHKAIQVLLGKIISPNAP